MRHACMSYSAMRHALAWAFSCSNRAYPPCDNRNTELGFRVLAIEECFARTIIHKSLDDGSCVHYNKYLFNHPFTIFTPWSGVQRVEWRSKTCWKSIHVRLTMWSSSLLLSSWLLIRHDDVTNSWITATIFAQLRGELYAMPIYLEYRRQTLSALIMSN